jgi:hypothetical protein
MDGRDIYRINYVNLKTGKHETETLASGLQFNHIDGVQRGLVVLRDALTDEITRAYEVFAYFHKYDQTGSPVQFQRQETSLSEDEIRKRLGKNKGLEVLANLNPNLTVLLIQKIERDFPAKNAESKSLYVPLERHLMEQYGAFSKSVNKRTKIIKNNEDSNGN